jgi:hypothetical protein
MSTKTTFKRLALGTVVTVSAGLLSVTTAHASTTTTYISSTIIASNSTTGSAAVVSDSAGSGASASVSVLGASATLGNTALSATLLNGGVLTVQAPASGDATGQKIVVGTGGYIAATAQNASGITAATLSVDSSSFGNYDSAHTGETATALSVEVKASSGSTGFSVSVYNGSTLAYNINVTVAPTSAYNAFSAAKSTVYWGSGSSSDTTTADATSSNYTAADGGTLKAYITLKDAYGNALTSSAKALLTITSSAGTVVDASTSTKGSGSTAYVANATSIAFNVQQATAHAGAAVTVTIAINGTVFATKTGTIAGEVASIKVTSSGFVASSKDNSVNGSNSVPVAVVNYYDGAGNSVYPTTGFSAVSSTLGSVVSNLTAVRYPTSTLTGTIGVTCASAGTQKGLKVQIVNPDGSIVTSGAFDLSCGGDADTYKVAFDSANYKLGGLATLTITFYDSKGNLANGFGAIAATKVITVANAPGSSYVSAPAAGDLPQSGLGTLTYKFPVTAVDGSYQAVVSVPELNAVDGTSQTVAYTVATGGTSLNDVLKGIVSLIASINKQIAALAKLVSPAKKK